MQERKKAVLLNHPFSIPIIADHGVLFYVYSNTICEHNNSYIELNGLGNGETVTVDCLMGTVIDSNKVNRFDLLTGYNLIGLERGNNNITLSGRADVEFICEFPIII